ncbi:hypothetical protein FA95DRAFT_1500957 [Auriscalpium vulgare]|uniref:Uncharacterized protein n=1 Tax=Auriscalpium vulgare TaxID=40419 RepID=A0ACB8RDT6_9AGAM|nr:hypothetical protein FA95DRAFT_1500957 [Auriscalpium vulgare]
MPRTTAPAKENVTDGGLRAHVCTHPGCLKSFTRLSYLTRHSSAIHGEQTTKVLHGDGGRARGELSGRVCRVKGCGRRFSRPEHMRRHVMTVHSDEKPFHCDFKGCGKRFNRQDKLAQHQRVH